MIEHHRKMRANKEEAAIKDKNPENDDDKDPVRTFNLQIGQSKTKKNICACARNKNNNNKSNNNKNNNTIIIIIMIIIIIRIIIITLLLLLLLLIVVNLL